MPKKIIWPSFQRIIELFRYPKNFQKALKNIGLGSGIRDPGSRKNLFRIPDPGVKKAPDPDPQHCFFGAIFTFPDGTGTELLHVALIRLFHARCAGPLVCLSGRVIDTSELQPPQEMPPPAPLPSGGSRRLYCFWQRSGSVSFWPPGSVIICMEPDPSIKKQIK